MAIYSEYHVEFNSHSLMNRNDPQQVEIFGPGSLKNRYVRAVAQFTSILSLRGLAQDLEANVHQEMLKGK